MQGYKYILQVFKRSKTFWSQSEKKLLFVKENLFDFAGSKARKERNEIMKSNSRMSGEYFPKIRMKR